MQKNDSAFNKKLLICSSICKTWVIQNKAAQKDNRLRRMLGRKIENDGIEIKTERQDPMLEVWWG